MQGENWGDPPTRDIALAREDDCIEQRNNMVADMLRNIKKTFSRRTSVDQDWKDWSDLPSDYADGPRELRHARDTRSYRSDSMMFQIF